ncbi:MAG: CapA family protein [Bacteroidales bacterium]|nr:CapA family protein [Bacteroidales bacterium]MDD4030241.1 CapA family protein [Bacteroidales bacterium]MDD4436064.1 CapA family protein [Bacteroidales bacterium]MDD5732502.1 CapA family protein [Bacteroidales bacterium]HPB77736.1 CapA family protein [Bacteroidales bacterium]
MTNKIRTALVFIMFCLPLWVFSKDATRVRFCFAGDLMQHGSQIRSARQADGTYLYDTCFAFVRDRFYEADYSAMNIETTFSGPPYTGYPSFSSPGQLAVALKRAGVNVFLTANNHILDKGVRGAAKTIALYDSLGVYHIGTTRPWIILEKNGINTAFLNYTYTSNNNTGRNSFSLNLTDTSLIREHIRQVRDKGADCIICCMHWGVEYQLFPSQGQRQLARWLRQEGVLAVIGSHPHVPQSIDVDTDPEGKTSFMAAYSLGNLISNQPDPLTRMGMILCFDLVLTKKGPRIESAWYEWIWTWRPVGNGVKTYLVLPVSDDRLYSKVVKDPSELELINETLKTLRNFMRETSPGIVERKRYPAYERKNLYFGIHPSVRPLWTRQPIDPPVETKLSPIKGYRQGRTTQGSGTARNN